MTALLLFKQKLKNFYSNAEVFLLPVMKFLLALIYFMGINYAMGFMQDLNNPFIVLILSLLCAVLPWNVIVYMGFALIIGHCYAISLETAVFVGVLILFMVLVFMRFSRGSNIAIVFTQLMLGMGAPALLSIGTGLLSDLTACMPAGCGVVLFYFISYAAGQANILHSTGEGDTEMLTKIKTLADGVLDNQEMWLAVIAVVAVILVVRLIRSASFDYAWRVSIVVGGVAYVFIMLAGSLFLGVNVNMAELIVSTLISVLIGIVLEFFVFGGDYTRTERLEYEDDEYYYYVKAVPKASVATTARSIKKITSAPVTEEERRKAETSRPAYANPIFDNEDTEAGDVFTEAGVESEFSDIHPEEFEKKLEESLRDL
ncbi:MAG: hypothetical protein Q4E89_08055 [Eubacteriales bacterium]|nr:hypothetical protein [Eubacteriales bacterium]